MIQIRGARPEDMQACVAIANLIRPEPVTVEEWLEQDQMHQSAKEGFFRRFVAEDESGRVIGYGVSMRMTWHPPGRATLGASVHPNHRGKGAGLALYSAAQEFAREQGATSVDAWCRGEDDASFAWAQRRGFALEKQRTESVLDLSTWNAAPFGALVERVRASGLRLELRDATLVEDDALMRQIYEVDCVTTPDVPFWNPESKLPSYEEFLKDWQDSSPKTCALAFDGDRLVGMSNVWLPRIPGKAAYNGYTAVLREYRGRGLALALKVLSTESAAAFGAPRMRTNNDPDNAPMLAVNAKLGYQLIPGPRFLVKSLA